MRRTTDRNSFLRGRQKNRAEPTFCTGVIVTQPYHEYVNHMLRQFFSDSAPSDPVGQLNRDVCDRILRGRSEQDVSILRRVFTDSDKQSIRQAVRFCAEQDGIPEVRVWKLVRDTSREIAHERGLI